MSDLSRFTVSLPSALLAAVDGKLVEDDGTRSGVVRQLLERAVREAEEQEEIARYIEGYRNLPQTEADLGWLDEVVPAALSGVPRE